MNNLIDIHNHSLPNVDDGAKNIDEALSNIVYLSGMGYTDIVLTSHYIVNSKYQSNIEQRTKILKELRKRLPVKVNLYLGNEVYITEASEILELLEKREIATINDSKYLLLEFPLNYEIHYLDRLLCELNEAGIIPIIAHPERYTYFQKKYKKINKVLDFNCLLQVNLESLGGKHGKKAKKYAKYLLKEGLVSILATDLHNLNHKRNINKHINKAKKIVGDEVLEKLVKTNPKKVLENEDII